MDINALFLEEFFEKIWSLTFPKNLIDVYVSCQSEKNLEMVGKIVEEWNSADIYRSVTMEKDLKGKFQCEILNLNPRFGEKSTVHKG